jgi:hypothetical protein
MTGGNSPRIKGYDAEREIVTIAREAGCEAKRTPTSKYPDLQINGRPVSAKRRKSGLEWIYKELEAPQPHDYILYRTDRKYWLKISKWKP